MAKKEKKKKDKGEEAEESSAESSGSGESGEGEAEGEGESDEGGGFGLKKVLLFIVLPLVLLGAAGGGLYFTGMLDRFLGKPVEGEHAAEDNHGEETADVHGKKDDGHGKKKDDGHGKKSGGHGSGSAYFLQIPNMLVNLSGTEGQPRYLRLSVQLEFESQSDMDAVEAVMPRVVDQFQTYLRELRVKDLRGSAGIYRLQAELLSRVNAAAYPVEVKDVLFQEILIQ